MNKRKGRKKYSDCYDIWVLNMISDIEINPFENRVFRSFIEGFSGYVRGGLVVEGDAKKYMI